MQHSGVFYQLFDPETSTYTYLIGDSQSGEAALIDPVLEMVDRDLKLIAELGLRLSVVLDTHIHADHITGAGELRKRTGAKTAVSSASGVKCADILLNDGDEVKIGSKTLRALATPGHTDSCMSYVYEDSVFTGDALTIRGAGRTDFQQGSSERLYDSVHLKLFTLPDATRVYPGHDYRGQTVSSIALEKKFNPRLGGGRTKSEFTKIMSELKLANPKKIHEAVPANLACGVLSTNKTKLTVQMVDGVPEIAPGVVAGLMKEQSGGLVLVDVRRQDEFVGELGHISGAKLITLGPALSQFLQDGNRTDTIVFICRSGARSGNATAEALQLGYLSVANMSGGMIRWNSEQLPVER